MSEQFPSGEGQNEGFTDLSEFDSFAPVSKRLSRNGIIGVAAGLVLACGVGVGFVYVNSDPAGDVASAAPVPGATSSSEATSSASGSSSAFAGSGRDAFDNTVAPKVATTSVAASAATAGTSSSTGNQVAPSTSGGTGTAKATSSTKPSNGTSSATKTSSSPATPTASRSTAPAWEQPQITYVGDYDALTKSYSFEVGGYTKWYPLGQILPGTSTVFQGSYSTPKKRPMTDEEKQECVSGVSEAVWAATDGCTTITEAIASALFTSTQGTDSGWVVTANNTLPAAALGKSAGTVRFVGYVEGKSFVLEVNREQSRVAVGEQVPGTSLTLRGLGVDEISRTDVVAFTGADGNVYFTTIGAGEDAGVLF
jgi:hypothetical protein